MYLQFQIVLQVNLKDRLGNTVLHKAAEQGLVSVCRHLVANGANLSLLNSARRRPIEVATSSVAEVLREGEEGEALRGDMDEESRLLEAAKNGDLATVKVCESEM